MTGAIILNEIVHGKRDLASSRIRGKWLVKYWPEVEEYVTGRKYDFLIFQKAYLVDLAKMFNGIKIFDICDPDWINNEPVIEMIELCDAVTCSSPNLYDYLKKITKKPVYYIPDRIDMEYIGRRKKIHRGQAKEVVWFGYSHNSHVLKSAVYALRRYKLGLSIITENMTTITVYGEMPEDKRIPERWTKWDLNTFCDEALKSDICIMPGSLRSNDRFKSNNKTILAQALGLPVATNADDLKRFLDPKARQEEADKKYKEVREKYDIRRSVDELKQIIKDKKKNRD